MATKEQYRRYVEEFKELEKKFKKDGRVLDDRIMTKEEYDTMHALWVRDNAGNRKKLTNIARQIVERQAYTYTRDHAEAIQDAFRKLDPEARIALEDIMLNEKKIVLDMWEQLKQEKDKLIASGVDIKTANEVISNYYFGS